MRIWGLLMFALLGARSGELPERELAENPYAPVPERAPHPYDREGERASASPPRAPSSREIGGNLRLALAPSPYEFRPPLQLAPSPYDLSLAPDPYVDLPGLGTGVAGPSLTQAPTSLHGRTGDSRRRPALAPSPYELGPPLGLAPNPY